MQNQSDVNQSDVPLTQDGVVTEKARAACDGLIRCGNLTGPGSAQIGGQTLLWAFRGGVSGGD